MQSSQPADGDHAECVAKYVQRISDRTFVRALTLIPGTPSKRLTTSRCPFRDAR